MECTECIESIASKDRFGKCSLCNESNGWMKTPGGECFCNNFVVPNQ